MAVGGTVSQMGDGGDGNVTLSAALTLAHAACLARDEDTGIVFTVNGDPELAVGLLKQVYEAVKEDAKLEQSPKLEGRFMSIVLAPGKVVPGRPESSKESDDAEDENA